MGGDLIKIMPPTQGMKDKGNFNDRRIGMNTGWKTTIANRIEEIAPDEVEHDWYIQEAHKLVDPLRRV